MSHPLVDAAGAAQGTPAARILELVGDQLAATEEVLRSRLTSEVPFIQKSGEYLFHGGGKRMRPALLLLCSRLLGRDSREEITYAAVVELIHTATLVHDDIIDHAATRRGRRTLHSVWGANLTVLVGDWLYATAMRMAIEHDNLRVIDLMCDATLRMTEGELLVLERLGALDVGVEEYLDIVDRKTARLFAAACSVPAVMRPARPEAFAPLESYGRALGTCFQMVDDLLDYTARQEDLGKPVLSDLKEGKLTLPLILALPRLSPAERGKIAAVLEERAFARVRPEEILELVRREGTLDETLALAERQAAVARAALAGFPDSDARRALELAPDYVLRRRA